MERTTPKIDDIIRCVGEISGIGYDAIMGSRRTMDVVTARQCAYTLARQLTAKSYPEIGAVFGRDHTSVIYGVQNFMYRMPTDVERKWLYDRSMQELCAPIIGYIPARSYKKIWNPQYKSECVRCGSVFESTSKHEKCPKCRKKPVRIKWPETKNNG